jgi:hypothetical protein
MQEGAHLESLISEYEDLLLQSAQSESTVAEVNLKLLVGALCKSADWTERGADIIVRLATAYGAFVLRNALALAVALETEDGELGF